ncbi:ribosomal protein S17 [Cavenderia fasciculata]|uniref:Ribosomal protein S17 n=1 Tax=Cavenderia fasciculata TaxID=261658 RepID=F4PQ42_CACFS|nr:ribosomal protein S17 [Cavenderia fasciculata]EGG22505.1 ribosomal protein S17 [Cavenderia fasciculata]|eukprot:XP_004360356.1 ribosomal protein S17 [Cavenderia fasciculata]
MISKVMDILGRGRKILRGTIISKHHTKTAMVEVPTVFFDATKYSCVTTRKTKYMIDDPEDKCIVGDFVQIVPCAPVSKRKTHTLLKITKRPLTTEFILQNPHFKVTNREVTEQKTANKIKYIPIDELVRQKEKDQ